ncbi:MAG: sugar MFS transporter [Cryomorphaceae bacterium]
MPTQSPSTAKAAFRSAFILLIMLFFMWGFITSLNDILIPHLKAVFDLNYTQAMLVQFCFFGSYFIMSVPAGRIIEKLGYSSGIVIGLVVMGLGCLLFYPASVLVYYPLFLLALFIMASGITVLQVAANPFVAAVGPPETASSRLNLSQGFNSLAHTIAPAFGTFLILTDKSEDLAVRAQAVQLPYIGLAIALFLIAGLFAWVKLPKIHHSANDKDAVNRTIWQHRNLSFGVLAIFLYVGIEVSIGGFLVNFFGESHIAGLPEEIAGHYVSYYWGGAMVGRFIGSAVLQRMKTERLLAISALGALALVAVTLFTSGSIAMVAILGVGLFNSVMFPNIFTLAIKGLGKYTSRASGLLVMAIVGGAIVPVIQGLLADSLGVQASFAIGLLCYGYVLFYALKGHKAH